jgi:quercetin dioxygenase-like cupin family protein
MIMFIKRLRFLFIFLAALCCSCGKSPAPVSPAAAPQQPQDFKTADIYPADQMVEEPERERGSEMTNVQTETAIQSERSETLLRPRKPELSMLRITIPPHTKLEWHSHPIPSAAYIVSGELTLEREKDGKKQHFAPGQAVSEMVDTLHRGLTGDEPVVLIVFYAGSPDVALTRYPLR